MRLFLLIPISCFFFSCLTTPKIDLKNNDSKIWTENISKKGKIQTKINFIGNIRIVFQPIKVALGLYNEKLK